MPIFLKDSDDDSGPEQDEDSILPELAFDDDVEDQNQSSTQYKAITVESTLIKLLVYFLLMFQTMFHLSESTLSVLFAFIRLFHMRLASMIGSHKLVHFAEMLPHNIKSARLCVSTSRDNFTKYVCCPKCFSTYTWYKVPTQSGNSLDCNFVQFPTHPQRQHRKPCGTRMFKEVKLSSGKITYHPLRVYCYKSVVDSLQEMLDRPHFVESCEAWRSINNTEHYCDVYDGKVWKDFLSYNGQAFLCSI